MGGPRGWFLFSIFSVLPGAVASCGGVRGDFRAVAPETYVLSHVAGAAVPAVAIVRPDGVTMIVADTLWLRDAGAGEEVIVTRDSVPGQAARPARRERREVHYRRSATRIDIDIPCPRAPAPAAPSDEHRCTRASHYSGATSTNGLQFEMGLSYMTPFVIAPRH